MIKPSRKLAVFAVTAGLMVSSIAVFAGNETVIYDQSNVGISAAVDRYVEATADTEAATVKDTKAQETASLTSADKKDTAKGAKTVDKSTEATSEDGKKADVVEYSGDALTAGYEGKAVVIADEPLNLRQEPSTWYFLTT